MDINSTTAATSYAAARPAMAPDPDSGATALGLINDFAASMHEAEAIAVNAMTTGVDPHALVQALAQTELAVETAVTLRDRMVEAYQEILRMPV